MHVATCKFTPWKSAANPEFDGWGYHISTLVSFHTPSRVPETVPPLSFLKSDVTGNFIEFLLESLSSAIALLQLRNASGYSSTCPSKGGSFPTPPLHPSHLFRQPPRATINWPPFLMKNISTVAGFQEVAGWANKGLRVIRV